MKPNRSHPHSSRGLALIAVLWMVAAMGLIVTGVVKAVRTETSSSGQQRQTLQAQSQADALIMLALQSLYFQPNPVTRPSQSANFEFAGQSHAVQVSTLNGLIDINNAPPELLAQLYAVAGGLTNSAAQALAQSTVKTREIANAKAVQAKFDAPEDLLRVPGMTYDLYAMIRALLTADLKDGSGRVNPLAAPVSVLQVLTGGDAAKAAALYANRNTPLTGMDTTAFNPAHIENSLSTSLRLHVELPINAQGLRLVRVWDVFGMEDPRTGLPWRILGKSHTLTKTSAEN